MASSTAEIPGNKVVNVMTGAARTRLEVDSIICLPELIGPSIEGLARDAHGFLPVDAFGHVDGDPRIFAAGDGTTGAVKLGGLAAQQAEVAARGAAHAAGADVEPQPLRPVLSGLLLTGSDPIVLGPEIDAPAVNQPGRTVSAKVAAPRLSAYLATHAPAAAAARS
jgi:hypothetical protein